MSQNSLTITRSALPNKAEANKIEIYNLLLSHYRSCIDEAATGDERAAIQASEAASMAISDIGRLRRELQDAGFEFKVDRSAAQANARQGLEAAERLYKLALDSNNSALAAEATEHKVKFERILKTGLERD